MKGFYFFLVLVIVLCLSGCGDSQSKSYYERFSKDFASLDGSQKNFIKHTYDSLEQYPDDFIYALLAIAWQESSFGKNVYNHQDPEDPSCGAFQQNLASGYLTYLGINNRTSWAKSKICLRLIEDKDFALSQAIKRLKEWQVKHQDRWDEWEYVYRSYNAGGKCNTDQAKIYAKMIKARIKVLEEKLEDIL